jgi:glutamate/aspartate transport system substrate-binding protein
MRIRIVWRFLLAVITLMMSMPVAQAQGYGKPTIEKIREYGAIYVGYRETSVPFSYLVGDTVVGYSKDVCDRLIEAIRVEIGNPGLKVVQVPVTSSSRLLMLMTSVIDLECGSTTNTKIRQQAVDFGVTMFVSGVKALVSKSSGIVRVADLNGKLVVTTAGTTTERVVKTVLAGRNAIARFKTARTHSESFAMLAGGQVDAFVLDDAILSGLLANSPHADKLKLLEEDFGFEPYGIGLRRNDPAFKKLIDATLIEMMKSGELEKIYNKWFLSPIPPNNVNLQIPMSDMLKKAIRNPNDKGI